VSTATQRDVEAHDTLVRSSASSTSAVDHELLVGFVDVATSPSLPTATQDEVVLQDTPTRLRLLERRSPVHAERPPVGSVDSRTAPPLAATHIDGDGQETPSTGKPQCEVLVAVQAEGPPVGSVEATRLSSPSKPTQNDSVGQDKEAMLGAESPVSMLATVHADEPPVGCVAVRTVGCASSRLEPPTTRSDTDGHETSSR
jgi:hypothetical protein